MDRCLTNKRILFFSPAFFGYEQKIKDKFQELGATVDMFNERSVIKTYQLALLKVVPSIFFRITERYYFNILEKIRGNKYDYILFVKCDMPTDNVLRNYRNVFKRSKFCLHMWDSTKNIRGVIKKFSYFDYISSFDRNDYMVYEQIHFRPLFYCDDYKKALCENNDCKYDLCFVGTIHSDRYKILKEIRRQAEAKNLLVYIYPYLQSRFIYYFYKITKPEFLNTKISDFKFKKLSSQEIAEIINESRLVIDIQHPEQTGLTMRTIEMLGMSKKIMTTNADIEHYDFYNPDNICIIDRNKIVIGDCLNKEYCPLGNELYMKYSLEAWAYGVLGIEK